MMLYLIRHGESTGNRQRLLFGRSDHPLTEEGRLQAAQVRDKLADIPIEICYCSPLTRAAETARICFGGRDTKLVSCPGLQEQDMGQYEDMDFHTIETCHPDIMKAVMTDWYTFVPEGGESFTDVCTRTFREADRIIARDQDCAIVAHNGPLSALTAHLLGADPARFDSFYFAHGCYTAIELGNSIHGARPILRCFNR